jgi:hypothetical protein
MSRNLSASPPLLQPVGWLRVHPAAAGLLLLLLPGVADRLGDVVAAVSLLCCCCHP